MCKMAEATEVTEVAEVAEKTWPADVTFTGKLTGGS